MHVKFNFWQESRIFLRIKMWKQLIFHCYSSCENKSVIHFSFEKKQTNKQKKQAKTFKKHHSRKLIVKTICLYNLRHMLLLLSHGLNGLGYTLKTSRSTPGHSVLQNDKSDELNLL